MMKYDSYIMLGLAVAGGLIAWGAATTRISADESSIHTLQGQYETISSTLSALAIGQATITQKVTDIDSRINQ
jgi:hypothetical protein